MPVYEFVCEKCDHPFTLILSVSERSKKDFQCPICKSKEVKQEISTFQTVTSKKS
jgi:putative FmdB family regulatory protein